MRFGYLVSGIVLALASTNSVAEQPHHCAGPQLGTWRLESFSTEILETGEKTEPYGARPQGYLSYGADCRMYAIIVRQGRKAPAGSIPTDAEKIELFGGVLSYAGTYTIDGDKVSHHVDSSWNEAWTGTTQVREFRVEGKTLRIRSMPAKNPRDGRLSSSTIVWTKVQ